MSVPTLASETPDFPYVSRQACWILVSPDGVQYASGAVTRIRELVVQALAGKGALYMVWPGSYRNDLFLVDDLEKAAKSLGVTR